MKRERIVNGILVIAMLQLAGMIQPSTTLAQEFLSMAKPSSRYMGGKTELVTAPNGAIINKSVLEEAPKVFWTNGPEIKNPAKGIYVVGGYSRSAAIVVEARDGLIIEARDGLIFFDTGDTKRKAKTS